MEVASFTDAWIETKGQEALDFIKKSHLLQMRGLKHKFLAGDLNIPESHLLQMRGLKHEILNRRRQLLFVASFTDAWIETSAVGQSGDSK